MDIAKLLKTLNNGMEEFSRLNDNLEDGEVRDLLSTAAEELPKLNENLSDLVDRLDSFEEIHGEVMELHERYAPLLEQLAELDDIEEL